MYGIYVAFGLFLGLKRAGLKLSLVTAALFGSSPRAMELAIRPRS